MCLNLKIDHFECFWYFQAESKGTELYEKEGEDTYFEEKI